jgi:hypothetical protein
LHCQVKVIGLVILRQELVLSHFTHQASDIDIRVMASVFARLAVAPDVSLQRGDAPAQGKDEWLMHGQPVSKTALCELAVQLSLELLELQKSSPDLLRAGLSLAILLSLTLPSGF